MKLCDSMGPRSESTRAYDVRIPAHDERLTVCAHVLMPAIAASTRLGRGDARAMMMMMMMMMMNEWRASIVTRRRRRSFVRSFVRASFARDDARRRDGSNSCVGRGESDDARRHE